MTAPSSPRPEHPGTRERHTVDTINSDQLDELYDRLAEAQQHTAAIAAQRDRLRQRMNNLADRWDHALAPDKAYARTLRDEISVAPFDPDGAMAVREYTERGRHLWAFRCWGTETCDGWLGLGHHTQTSALVERERHAAEAHSTEEPATDPELRRQLDAAIAALGKSEAAIARVRHITDLIAAGDPRTRNHRDLADWIRGALTDEEQP